MEIRSRKDFINALFEFFNAKNTESLFQTYETLLKCDFPVDWNAFYLYVAKNAEYKTLPMPKLFIDLLPKFKKQVEVYNNADVGSWIRVVFKKGLVYDFAITSGDKGTSISDILEENKGKIASIVRYPAGIKVVGTTFCYQTDDEFKKNELEKEIKTLYKA